MEDKKTYPIQPLSKGPRRAKMPTHRAQRWLADSEDGRKPVVQVFLTQAAYQRICAHAKSDLDNEVGGWLAGRWCRDGDTKAEFVVVEALLPAQQVRSGSTFLTFTHDSQVAMLAALEERYSKKGVVGWYHTHPRMGVFLSGYDVWLHNHFFPQPWQVALVVEPHSGVAGFFVRDRENNLDARKYFGFYELHNRRVESVMQWKNLHPEKQPELPNEETKSEANLEAKPDARRAAERPKEEPKKVEVKAPPLQRKEFKALIAPLPAKAEAQDKNTEVKTSDQKPVSSRPQGPNKQAPTRVEMKPTEAQRTETKKFEIKTEVNNGKKNSEEA